MSKLDVLYCAYARGFRGAFGEPILGLDHPSAIEQETAASLGERDARGSTENGGPLLRDATDVGACVRRLLVGPAAPVAVPPGNRKQRRSAR